MNQVPDQIVIPLSRTKIVLLLLGAVAFVLLSAWLWTIADHQTRHNPFYVKGAAIAGASFFGLCAGFAFIKLFDPKPGLIIDAEGIVDNSSGVSAGRIPWREIRGFRVTTVQKQRFITFEVEDPLKYVDRGNFLRRKLNRANLKYFGSPVQISANALQIKFDELLSVIAQFYERHKDA